MTRTIVPSFLVSISSSCSVFRPLLEASDAEYGLVANAMIFSEGSIALPLAFRSCHRGGVAPVAAMFCSEFDLHVEDDVGRLDGDGVLHAGDELVGALEDLFLGEARQGVEVFPCEPDGIELDPCPVGDALPGDLLAQSSRQR